MHTRKVKSEKAKHGEGRKEKGGGKHTGVVCICCVSEKKVGTSNYLYLLATPGHLHSL